MLERHLRDDGTQLAALRVLVVGDAAVGKSSLVETICGSGATTCSTDRQSEWTCGCALSIAREMVEINMRLVEVEVELWEVGGTQTYAAARPVFYDVDGFDALILVYDVSNMKSYQNLVVWLFELCTSVWLPSLRYWDMGGGSGGVPDMDLENCGDGHAWQQAILSGRCPALFVANKYDLRGASRRTSGLQQTSSSPSPWEPKRPQPPDRLPLLDRLLGGGDGLPSSVRRSAADQRLLEQLCDFVSAGRHTEATSKAEAQSFDFVLWREFLRHALESRQRAASR